MTEGKQKVNFNSEEVYQFLKGKFVNLEFRPGHLLSESVLVTEFNLSRTPVRTALSRMARDGLVEIVPRKGAFVRFLSVKDVKEIFEIRQALEGAAVRKTADRLDPRALDRFEQFYLKALDRSHEKLEKISSVGLEFHQFFIKNAGNERISKILDDLLVQLSICRIFFLNQDLNIQPSRYVESTREHLSIIQALKNGDGELAEKKMKEHLANAEKYTFSFQS